MNWYKKANKWKEHIPGGRAEGKRPSDYEKSQVERGKNVEFEHTKDPGTAKEIAMDHLEEFDDYYVGLEHMENMLKEIGKREKKKAGRGRYPGQSAGDERRPDSGTMTEILDDNDLVEGEFVKVLHRMAVEKDWNGFNQYIQKLKDEGHNHTRINSMMTRAMYGVKL